MQVDGELLLEAFALILRERDARVGQDLASLVLWVLAEELRLKVSMILGMVRPLAING